MRNLFLFLLPACLFTQSAKAIPITGGQLTYQWLADSSYQFNLVLYSPCDSPFGALPASTQLCYFNSCGASGTMPMLQVSVTPGGNASGFKEYHYTSHFTLSGKCNDWTFYISVPDRNNSNNLQNNPGHNLYLEATLNNTGVTQFSSPLFTKPKVIFHPYSISNYNPGLSDPNSDSLYVELVQPSTKAENVYTPANCNSTSPAPIPYQSATFNNLNNPFATNNTLSLNQGSGMLNFVADTSALGYNTIALRVKKYRSGFLLGTIVREEQIRVTPNPASMVVSFPMNPNGFKVPVGMSVIGLACVGHPFSFEIHAVQPPGYSLASNINTNATTIFPNSIFAITGGSQGVSGTYSYTPTITDTGTHTLLFEVDSYTFPSCLLPDTANIKQYFIAVVKIDTCVISGLSTPKEAQVSIYPNPARNHITIQSPATLSATIITTDGRSVLHKKNTRHLDISHLSPGIYFIHLADDKGDLVRKEKLVKLE